MPRLSAEALKARIAALQKQLAAAENSKAPAIRKVRALMKKLGVTMADLAETPETKAVKRSPRRGRPRKADAAPKKPATKIPVKYRDVNGNTWTGRGKTPTWIVEAENAGHSRDGFLTHRSQLAQSD
jgi:DNA-binding protein H-NS